ncbi:MAG: hypothetical protein NTW29_14540 [Bacteroidetes bacterium]|nr:hypothetical protein [Bacteroidota bacterium]
MNTFLSIAFSFTLGLAVVKTQAQNEIPKGFKKGTIILSDNSVQTGFVKDNMSKDASVWFIPAAGGVKKNYSGSDLLSAEIEGQTYSCINGDFFKVICKGELCFLQKQSDASGKVSYNGSNAVFSSGTEGRPGDYFFYTAATKSLQLISKKNIDEVAASNFKGNAAAIDKAKAAGSNLEELKEAVNIYNNTNK